MNQGIQSPKKKKLQVVKSSTKEIKLDEKNAKDLHDLKMQSSALSSQLGSLQYDYDKQKHAIEVEMERTDKRVMQIMEMLRKKHKIIGNIRVDIQNGKLLI